MASRHYYEDKRTYTSWHSMKQRCFNPRLKSFKDYGGRGIIVCERWLSYENFREDMGRRPEGKSLERKNNEGNYEPGNCRWATRAEQNSNQRVRKDNSTGHAGISMYRGKYKAACCGVYLGVFDNKTDAIAARRAYEARK